MSEERLKELQEYNLEYLEAQNSEEIFGGDYTSAVELKYAKKEIERLKDRDIKVLELIDYHLSLYAKESDMYSLHTLNKIKDILEIGSDKE